jgi:hypothetical protein
MIFNAITETLVTRRRRVRPGTTTSASPSAHASPVDHRKPLRRIGRLVPAPSQPRTPEGVAELEQSLLHPTKHRRLLVCPASHSRTRPDRNLRVVALTHSSTPPQFPITPRKCVGSQRDSPMSHFTRGPHRHGHSSRYQDRVIRGSNQARASLGADPPLALFVLPPSVPEPRQPSDPARSAELLELARSTISCCWISTGIIPSATDPKSIGDHGFSGKELPMSALSARPTWMLPVSYHTVSGRRRLAILCPASDAHQQRGRSVTSH